MERAFEAAVRLRREMLAAAREYREAAEALKRDYKAKRDALEQELRVITESSGIKICERCSGTGRVWRLDISSIVQCPACGGKGVVVSD